MTALASQLIPNAGFKPTFVAASLSDTAEYGNSTDWFVVYRNTDANPKTITITPTTLTSYGPLNPPVAFALAATTGEAWIPLRQVMDDGTGTGRVTLVLSGTGGATGVTVAVIKHS